MTMTWIERAVTIGMVVLGTMATRFLPFLLFPPGRPTPRYVQTLGKALPSAAIGLLVVYSLKDVSLTSGSRGIPELISVAAVALLHMWRRSMLLSIAGGTMLYIALTAMM